MRHWNNRSLYIELHHSARFALVIEYVRSIHPRANSRCLINQSELALCFSYVINFLWPLGIIFVPHSLVIADVSPCKNIDCETRKGPCEEKRPILCMKQALKRRFENSGWGSLDRENKRRIISWSCWRRFTLVQCTSCIYRNMTSRTNSAQYSKHVWE